MKEQKQRQITKKRLHISNENISVIHSTTHNSSNKFQNQIITKNRKTYRKAIIDNNITNNSTPDSRLSTKNKIFFERNTLYK